MSAGLAGCAASRSRPSQLAAEPCVAESGECEKPAGILTADRLDASQPRVGREESILQASYEVASEVENSGLGSEEPEVHAPESQVAEPHEPPTRDPKPPQTENETAESETAESTLPESEGPEPLLVVPPAPADSATSSNSIAIIDVINSIHSTFPLLEAAYQQNQIAAGNQTAAWGAFDTKLKAGSENGPLGFYRTYRESAGIERPIFEGGELFGGYRVGRGKFQPWFKERQTNEGGELKAGMSIPLLRNRQIDARRAELWRSTYDRQRARPEIRAQLIQFVRDGTYAYWDWVAAGRRYAIGAQALELARQRNSQIERKVEVGDVAPPVLQDNLRAIAQREAKLINLQRKLRQSAFKLSLFWRAGDGTPLVPEPSQLTDFPEPKSASNRQLDADIAMAFTERPELAALDLLTRSVNVDLAEAQNNMLPELNAQLIGSQDFGIAADSKRDKSQFEVEAGVLFEVPVERRKARGKIQAAHAKLIQLAAKRRFTEDKIRVEVQSAHAAVVAAFERLEKARESKRLATYMADVERRKFELGETVLLAVVLREQYAIEAAESEVDALLEYFAAQADYQAALARDWPLETD